MSSIFTSGTRFSEISTAPSDTKIISKTWAKVNKNGTPDKRFKSNYQIPVVRYENIRLSTHTGFMKNIRSVPMNSLKNLTKFSGNSSQSSNHKDNYIY